MKALTLTQPWATLVATGLKRVETRSWRTNYRGRIAIHAAKGFPKAAQEFASFDIAPGILPDRMPLGAIVATAVLKNCRPTEEALLTLSEGERHFGDYSPGRWAWFLEDVIPLEEPVGCLGALSLWEIPPETMALFQVPA